MNKEHLIELMKSCPQTDSQSVLEHGESVWNHFQILYDHLLNGTSLPDWWRIPQWVYDKIILKEIYSLDIIEEYLIYHDCGKPFCKIIDENGKTHFPNHSKISEKTWLNIGGNLLAAKLMGMDMDAHLLKSDGIDEFAKRPEAVTLLIAALSEIHSNAAMFGGIDSDSFKIKAKHLNKRGKQIMKIK